MYWFSAHRMSHPASNSCEGNLTVTVDCDRVEGFGVVPRLDREDRTDLRWGWLAVQDHRCGVCGVGVAERYGKKPRWVLDYDRSHGSCPVGGECFDCVQGTTCRLCMLHLQHFRVWSGYVPRQPVNGLSPTEWVAQATAYVNADFRSVHAGSAGKAGG